MAHWPLNAVLSAIIVISGCGNSSGVKHLSMDALRHAAYDIPNVGRVTLKDGAFDRESSDSLGRSPVHIGSVELFAFGDLDGDGSEDAVTFLAKMFGGPGIFLSLEVFLNKDGSPSHVASYLIGDRVGIDSVEIARGVINVHAITQAPSDSMCCPTLHVSKTLRLEKGRLIELNAPWSPADLRSVIINGSVDELAGTPAPASQIEKEITHR
jgi:hypothetical protein